MREGERERERERVGGGERERESCKNDVIKIHETNMTSFGVFSEK
jgi:hypothetical protein